MVNFFKETTDIKHGMTMEASIQFFIKLALVDAVFLNLTNILVFLIEIEQAFFGIIVPEDAASLVIRVGDDWEMSGSGLIFGNLFGLVFLFICLGGAVITLWTVYRVFLKLFFYMAVAPLALSTYAGPHEIGHTGSSWVRTFLCALFEIFQSTLPRGERLLLLPCSVPPFSISIHAPARGATWHTRYPQKSDQFQSTLPRGERQNRKQKGDFAQKFQSTLPRGERLDKV